MLVTDIGILDHGVDITDVLRLKEPKIVYHAGPIDMLLDLGIPIGKRDEWLRESLKSKGIRAGVVTPFTHAMAYLTYGIDDTIEIPPELDIDYRKAIWNACELMHAQSNTSLFDLLSTKTYGTWVEMLDSLVAGRNSAAIFKDMPDDPFIDIFKETYGHNIIYTDEGLGNLDSVPKVYEEAADLIGQMHTRPQPAVSMHDIALHIEKHPSFMKYISRDGLQVTEDGYPIPWTIAYAEILHHHGQTPKVYMDEPEGSNTYFKARDMQQLYK